ncbi:MAG: TonB-dependent receptor [Acidobacteria bacterium]|nr:TonB-dependent receptor [Acidobacteriota bacterium]
MNLRARKQTVERFLQSATLTIALGARMLVPLQAQVVSVMVEGRVLDTTGAAIPQASVTAVNVATGFSRAVMADATGDYQISFLPVGDYTLTVEKTGFKKQAKRIHLDIGAAAKLDFTLEVGQVIEEVNVQDIGELAEPTRTMVSSVIDQQKIEDLPVNGRQFIDFALLAPGVKIGDTTSGSTDVIIEPVTKLSFAGQNIHYNFIAVDGADNISTASGVQKYTPSQEAVREFRVINSTYSVEFGRAVGGIVNIITKGGTNQFHGSIYEYFRNDRLDAGSILASSDPSTCRTPGVLSSEGCKKLNKLRQNQYGFTLGGPLKANKTFFFGNYEGQRRRESPYYNSIILNNIDAINSFKQGIGFPLENLAVTRNTDYDNVLGRLDHSFSDKSNLFIRYFFNSGSLKNYSPLNDGFDLPSGFKNNSDKDHSLVGNLATTLTPTLVNELRLQYAHRNYDFPTASSQPHMEVANEFAIGVNRGNPDFYKESRFELVDDLTKNLGKQTLSLGGDYNWVRTTESFPLFYPFEATFLCINPGSFPCNISNLQDHDPVVLFFERFQAPAFNEPSFSTSVFQLSRYPDAVRNRAVGVLDHTYSGFFAQDNWRASERFTLNLGVRADGETWPNGVLDTQWGVDPRLGIAYSPGRWHNLVIRVGSGIFHGIVPAALLACQKPSCGGQTKFPTRQQQEDDLNSVTQLFGFASGVGPGGPMQAAFNSLVTRGTYPDAAGIPGFLGPTTIVRFTRNHRQPYGIQNSLSIEFEPAKDTVLNISYLRTHGVHLGSFYNINQRPNGQVCGLHDSKGDTGCKEQFAPASANFLFFEADSRWYSEFDGLLVNLNRRVTHHVGFGISYTWSKSLDDGPNPSFVLIPQNTFDFGAEKALSADHAAHRFVADATFTGPSQMNALLNNWQLSTIVTLESPHYFTKFAGLDTNADGFPINDRVGIEPRDTFKGDSYQAVDLRIARMLRLSDRLSLEALAESFNTMNTVNIRFFNTVYGAPDFIPPGTPGTFREGSPNPNYGTPRAVFNPRQIQLAVRLRW